MPNIPEYTAPQANLDTGMFAQTARRMGVFGQQEASAIEGEGRLLQKGVEGDIRDVGAAAVQFADYQSKAKTGALIAKSLPGLTQKYENALKGTPDPNNPGQFIPPSPEDLQRFYKDNIEEFAKNVESSAVSENGSRYAQEQANDFRKHFAVKIQADNANLTAKRIADDSIQSTNAYSATAAISADAHPGDMHTLDWLVSKIKGDSALHKGNLALSAEGEEGLNKQEQANITQAVHTFAVASILSKNNSDPDGTVKQIMAKYPEYIKPEEALTLSRAAEVQKKTMRSMDHAQQEWDQKQAGLRVEGKMNDIRTSVIEHGQPTPEDHAAFLQVLKDPANRDGLAAKGELIQTTQNWIRGQAEHGAEIIEDPKVVSALHQRVFENPEDPTVMADAMKANLPGGTVNTKTVELLDKEKKMLLEQTPEQKAVLAGHIKDVTTQFAPPRGQFETIDPQQVQLQEHGLSMYKQWFFPWYTSQLAAGKKPADLLTTAPGMAMDPLRIAMYQRAAAMSMPAIPLKPGAVNDQDKPQSSVQKIMSGVFGGK